MSVQFPVNRTTLREEENRPSPASQRVGAGAVIGPTPSAARPAPSRRWMPGGVRSWWRGRAPPGLDGGEHVPGRWRPAAPHPATGVAPRRPQHGQALLGAQHALAQRRGALVAEDHVDALRPAVCCGARRGRSPAAPGTCGLRRRDPALRAAGLGQQAAEVRGDRSCRSWQCRLRTRAAAVSAGSPICTAIPAAASSSATYRHPVHPSTARQRRRARRTAPSQAAQVPRSAGAMCAAASRSRCRDSRTSAASGGCPARLR